jgi:hypothetical protein
MMGVSPQHEFNWRMASLSAQLMLASWTLSIEPNRLEPRTLALARPPCVEHPAVVWDDASDVVSSGCWEPHSESGVEESGPAEDQTRAARLGGPGLTGCQPGRAPLIRSAG